MLESSSAAGSSTSSAATSDPCSASQRSCPSSSDAAASFCCPRDTRSRADGARQIERSGPLGAVRCGSALAPRPGPMRASSPPQGSDRPTIPGSAQSRPARPAIECPLRRRGAPVAPCTAFDSPRRAARPRSAPDPRRVRPKAADGFAAQRSVAEAHAGTAASDPRTMVPRGTHPSRRTGVALAVHPRRVDGLPDQWPAPVGRSPAQPNR